MRARPPLRTPLPILLAIGLMTAGAPRVAGQSRADSILSRPVTLVARGTPLADALLRLRHDHDIPLAWSGDALPPDARVTVTMRDESLRVALEALLRGTGLGFTVTQRGTVVIVPGNDSAGPPRAPGASATEQVRFSTGVPVGPWTGHDWAAVLSTEPRRAADRDYWIEYPGGLRPWVVGSFALGRAWRAMARVDDPGSANGTVRTNVWPPVGRLAVVGIEAQWR